MKIKIDYLNDLALSVSMSKIGNNIFVRYTIKGEDVVVSDVKNHAKYYTGKLKSVEKPSQINPRLLPINTILNVADAACII